MHPAFGHILGRLTRLLPNVTRISTSTMQADFFLPSYDHHIGKDLRNLQKGGREPRLYEWIDAMPDGSVFFDVGTHYGQESVWASCQTGKTINVTGFDCGLLQSHFCALNGALNKEGPNKKGPDKDGPNKDVMNKDGRGQFTFVFAAVGAQSGAMINITANSDTHIARLHKKNAPYHYQVPAIALDDYAAQHEGAPTHLKIDVDGAEADVITGAHAMLSGTQLREIFIEIDQANKALVATIADYGFRIAWEQHNDANSEYLFRRS